MSQLSDLGQQTLLGAPMSFMQILVPHLSGNAPELPEIVSGELAELRALFVSIHLGPALRGCIGNLHPAFPLYRSTAECAISAAVGDPRFPPLTPPELPHVSFEISVLSPIEAVRDLSDIEIGVHGLLVVKGRARGLLLPQVAVQYGWDRERFLAETYAKAGLGTEAKKGTVKFSWVTENRVWPRFSPSPFSPPSPEIYRFTAHVFSEQHIHHPATS